jgi:ribosome-binding factor A
MDEIRHRKLEEQLLEELARLIISGEIKDPRVGPFVSLTRVEAAGDLSAAKVYVSAFCTIDEDGVSEEKRREAERVRIAEAVDGLKHAAGFIQAQISRRGKLRLTPKLTFVADYGIKEGFELNERIKGLFQ